MNIHLVETDDFTDSYVEAMLWSSTDDNGNPIDRKYSESDLAPETWDKIKADCAKFQAEYGEQIDNADCYRSPANDYGNRAHAGHDFWLTRNLHGAGFWDGDWSKPQAETLTNAAHNYDEQYLYIGDDGKLYLS